jgi:CspA family cold shock protein
MNEGRVKIFDLLKGYGFITRPKGKDLFFHWTDINSKFQGAAVAAGTVVQYEIDEVKPHRAKNVQIVS